MEKVYLTYQQLKTASPFKQGLIIGGVSSLFMVLFSLFSPDPQVEWFIGLTSLGFYTWINAVFSFFLNDKKVQYVIVSVLIFLILSGSYYLLCSTLSEVDIMNIREFKLMYLITCTFYFCALMVATLIRTVAEVMGIKV